MLNNSLSRKTYKIERVLQDRSIPYSKSLQSMDIYNYKDRYNVHIDMQFATYLMIKKDLDDSYLCEIECDTQDDVIRILFG